MSRTQAEKKPEQKLSLKRETLRTLSKETLEEVVRI